MGEQIEFTFKGHDMKRKKASKSGNSSHIYLPKEWEGREVIAILKDPEEE